MNATSYSTALRTAKRDAREQAGYPLPLHAMDADRLANDYTPLVVTFADGIVSIDYAIVRNGARDWAVERLPAVEEPAIDEA